MTSQISIIEIALLIRPQLPNLLDVSTSKQMRSQLDALLQEAQNGKDVEDDIWDLLTDTRETQVWVTETQSDTTRTQKSVGVTLPGEISNISAPEFKCPHCERRWNRDRVGRSTPLCPIHKVPFEPVI